MQDWKPTHRITRDDSETLVMLDDEGRAYTESEWEAEAAADFEVVAGEWLFQGHPFSGSVEPVNVTA